MKKISIIILISVFVSPAFAKKKIYKYRKSQNHSFGPSEVLGKSYDPSEILNEEHPQSFKYIFDSKVKVIRKINKMSKYLGRSL